MTYFYNSSKKEPQHAPASLLTPENCLSTSRIRAFLRLSRIATDDTIRQHLNEIPTSQCDSYFQSKIAPQWIARAEAIQFCADYAKTLRQEAETIQTSVKNEVDVRINPYASKDAMETLEMSFSRCVSVENWTTNEMNVETILKEETAKVLSDKCYYKDWLQEFNKLHSSSAK